LEFEAISKLIEKTRATKCSPGLSRYFVGINCTIFLSK
jgi:hypothetical protein